MVSQPSTLRFGLFLGQPGKALQRILDEFELADELGFDQAYLSDHLLDVDGSPDGPCHEAWTTLTAVALRTRRVRLGVLVASNTFRHPALLVKQAVTVDHLSQGRLILGVGTGWHEDEHRRYGITFPSAAERVARLSEAVEIITRLMEGQRATFHGNYFHIEDAPLSPRPLQEPRIPLLIAAHRPRMLRIAARYADQWDTFGMLPGSSTQGVRLSLRDQIETLERECHEVGRDPSSISRSTWATMPVFTSPRDYANFVRTHAALGFTEFNAGLPMDADMRVMRRIVDETIPALRAELASGQVLTPHTHLPGK